MATPLPSPQLLHDYLTHNGFWAGVGDFDFWYAMNVDDWFWLHLRSAHQMTLVVTLFVSSEGLADFDLYNLSHTPTHTLRTTIVNTPLMGLVRFEPPLPQVALHLKSGASHYFTLPRTPETLPDQWLDEALQTVRAALIPRWQLAHTTWQANRATLAPLWPSWAGPGPSEEG